jgi:hypothetical protein
MFGASIGIFMASVGIVVGADSVLEIHGFS